MTIKNSLCLSHELQINDICISLCEHLKGNSISVFTKLVCNFHTFQCFALPPVLDKFTLHQVMIITFNDALTISLLNNCLGVLPLSGTMPPQNPNSFSLSIAGTDLLEIKI